jgi:hypothetical protein
MSSASPEGTSDTAAASASASDRAGASSASSRSSQPWTQADSAAGIVLRYIVPMRRQLVLWLGSETLSDECLRLLITHLITQGFGEHGRGRIRDFLLRGIRSAAKAVVAETPEATRPEVDFSNWTTSSKSWLEHWRAAILARAWRTLERQEHRDASEPLFSILRAATAHPRETPEMLALRIQTESQISVSPESIQQLLPEARRRFARLLLGEIGETLDSPGNDSIHAELHAIGLADAVDKLSAGQ